MKRKIKRVVDGDTIEVYRKVRVVDTYSSCSNPKFAAFEIDFAIFKAL